MGIPVGPLADFSPHRLEKYGAASQSFRVGQSTKKTGVRRPKAKSQGNFCHNRGSRDDKSIRRIVEEGK
jgi:hypothetical protein